MKKLLILIALLAVLVVPTQAAMAGPLYDDGTKVEKDETVNNDIVVFDGDLIVEEDATVNGDVILFNGDADIAGTVNGDVVVFNGDLNASNGAVINGDCVLLNGGLADDTDAGISCTDVENLPNFMAGLPAININPPTPPTAPDVPDIPTVQIAREGNGFWDSLGAAFLQSLLLGFFAFVIASLAPQQMGRIENAAARKPVASGMVGLLTAVAVPSIAILLAIISAILILVCIGLLGFPIIFLLLVGFAIAALVGWVTIGNLLGRKMVKGLNMKHRSLAVTATLGTFALTMIIGLMEAIPFVFGSGLVSFLITCVGLGAVVLTRFGTQAYPLGAIDAPVIAEDPEKVNAVLETLHIDEDDIADLKSNND